MKLSVLKDVYAVCRLTSDAELPYWIDRTGFWNVTKTKDELSVVCLQSKVPEEIKAERQWKIIKV